ncbi:charged multivesicular body protein 7 isoform X1 [Galleria mellonella]|uniref:Charged multivesicular body protein 7 isoform X1 n=1 Tax=Galleria mellonella TaxID=7137 RepID=A0ABM3MUC5_GALME|nr:charged multivesicular body protein 7 isoform X1 [Galleria mellonella]
MSVPGGGIPEDKLPQCWSDDVRMNALFAPFRIKTANPESWDMKMKFWSDMLRQWCRCKKDPILSAADAKFAFQRKGRTCACMDLVVEEIYRNGDLSPISKYPQILHNGPEGWVRWGARLAFKPAAIAITAVTSLLPARQALDSDGLPKASIDSTQRFVLESAVKEQATEFLQNYPADAEHIGTIEELMRNSGFQQSRETFEILLGYLVSQGTAVKKDDVVKIAEPHKKAQPVTETDEALVKLTSAETRLSADATRLAREVAAATAQAAASLQLGDRLAAKSHLRRKHNIQQRLTRCEGALDNVRQLLQQLKEVDVNAAIVDTYRTSSQAMKRGMKDGGLEEDAVHDTLDDLKEVMDTYNEVEKALGTTLDDFDAAELELELKELLDTNTGASGGTPAKPQKEAPKVPQRTQPRKVSERDFVFDGEERILAELNELDVEDSSPRGKTKPAKVAVADWAPSAAKEAKPAQRKEKPSKPWYPADGWGNNNGDYAELRQDDRLHPGQPLNVDFTTPPRLYNMDFQVRDHKVDGGVWLYNSKDSNSNTELAGTEYFSSESPGKTGGNFQMAPGGERKKQPVSWPGEEATVEDLERRLKNLRGFNLQ